MIVGHQIASTISYYSSHLMTFSTGNYSLLPLELYYKQKNPISIKRKATKRLEEQYKTYRSRVLYIKHFVISTVKKN